MRSAFRCGRISPSPLRPVAFGSTGVRGGPGRRGPWSKPRRRDPGGDRLARTSRQRFPAGTGPVRVRAFSPRGGGNRRGVAVWFCVFGTREGVRGGGAPFSRGGGRPRTGGGGPPPPPLGGRGALRL